MNDELKQVFLTVFLLFIMTQSLLICIIMAHALTISIEFIIIILKEIFRNSLLLETKLLSTTTVFWPIAKLYHERNFVWRTPKFTYFTCLSKKLFFAKL